MLLTLGLLLLITPLPSFQTITNERRNVTVSDVTKANAVAALSKSKTTAALHKQATQSILKPNVVNQTMSPTPSSNKKLPIVENSVNVKNKSSSTVTQAPTATANVQSAPADGAKVNKDKIQQSVNQSFPSKASSGSEGKTTKDKPALTASQNTQSASTRPTPASSTKPNKNKPTPSVNQTVAAKSPPSTRLSGKGKPVPSVPSEKAAVAGRPAGHKDKPQPTSNQTTTVKGPTAAGKDRSAPSQPIKVLISDGCESSPSKEQELTLKPGAPLVMTHKISLLPGGCAGGCEAEMAALKGRVARLEMEMSLIKEKCPCSANCLNDCSGNGECQKGKCVCQQGFTSPDCSKCAQGVECHQKSTIEMAKTAVETVTQQLTKGQKNTQSKPSKAEQMLFHQRDQKKGPVVKEAVRKASSTNTGVFKTQAKDERSVKKTTSTSTKTNRPTIGQVLLKPEGRKQEEARKGKTMVIATKKVPQKTNLLLVKQGTSSKLDQLKDEAQTNGTHHVRKMNGTSKIVTILSKSTGENKTRAGKDSVEQSTLAEKNVTQTEGTKHTKTGKADTTVQTLDGRRTEKARKGKEAPKSHYIVNATYGSSSNDTKALQKKVGDGPGTSTGRTGGSGLGSVKAVNISSYSFTITWSAPQGMFKNFTVIRREPRTEGDDDEQELFDEDMPVVDKFSAVKNTTEGLVHSEGLNVTARSEKTGGAQGRADDQRISMVVPGSVRAVEFSNLRANARYVLHIYGSTGGRRSKVHRVAVATGPEPATDMSFSNVTESSLTVSWSKPKTMVSGFRISYTNIVTGESHFTTVDSHQSSVVLSKLSAGTSYIVTVTAAHGQTQSDMLTALMTTVPAPPTHFQITNVTDTRALLQWKPSLGTVDRFIISYESSKTPNVTVTVMVSGSSVEHQLRGLQRGTLYRVKVLSQKDSLQSSSITTTFTTANVAKASEVHARSAVITWRSTVVYHSYKIIYQVVGEESKELILESTVTEYKLTGLLPMSRYFVLVQGERDGHYTSIITTEFITGKLRFPFPTECSQELLNGALHSGEVDIYPHGKEGGAVKVYCDMETDGGGWTVFQRRMNGKTDFYRTWSEYSAGFGNLSEEFWLGNEILHNLTSVGPVSLRVDMHSGTDNAYAVYANFSVDSEDRHYALTVSGYSGTAGDSMRYHNGRPFSTRDKDPDPLGIHCARAYMGGWWYKNCYKTNLNGLFGFNSDNQGVVWIDWKGKDVSIPFTEMKFRPSRFSPTTLG